MKKIFFKCLHILIFLLIAVMFAGVIQLRNRFSSTNLEEIIFYFKTGIENADGSAFVDIFISYIPFIFCIVLACYVIFYDITFDKVKLYSKKGKRIYPFDKVQAHRNICIFIVFMVAFIMLLNSFKIFDYVIYNNLESNFIEENYVNPKEVNIEFSEKRNLIFIVVESLETTLFSKDNNGYWDYDVIPELEELLNEEDVVTFYDNNKRENMKMLQGSSWTTASIVANSTGLPLKLRACKNDFYSNNFMNGAYALGDLLADNGYHNELISSANTSFGGIKDFYQKHGSYDIIDVDSLKKYGLKMKKNDKGDWGFNDKFLFETAKKRLQLLSKEEPFNLELITIDTHFVDGYIGNYSETKYKDRYENSFATSSKLIYEFVSWVRKQDFYDNTTIVIVGDHLSMQNDFFRKRGAKVDDRYVYSCIINSSRNIKKTNNRKITALDTYPTVVSALGGHIDGNKLGLGVNLFSSEKTLIEKNGFNKLNSELKKKSKFYDKNILNDAYLKKYDI